MPNIVNINSANIVAFGFTSVFDLLAKTLTFDISALTVFKSGGAANVVGIAFQVTDPSGVVIANIDFSSPAIDPSTQTTYTIPITSGFAMFGFYNITGAIQDQDTKIYQVTLIKQVCQPEGFNKYGYVPGVFNLISDCNIPQVTINEFTRFVLQGKPAINVAKTGILSYPPGTLEDLAFTYTPVAVGGSGQVFTGRYTINNTSVASFDLGDGVTENVSFKTIGYEKIVSCNSALDAILCCMNDLACDYRLDPYSSTGKSIKEKFDRIAIDFQMAVSKQLSGQDASEDAARIAKILGCNCDCSSDAISPRPIITGGTEINYLTIVGAGAANVSNSEIESTTQYTILVKDVSVTNLNDDLAININLTSTDTTKVYAISFNYGELAGAILDEIQSDDDLLSLLKNMVGAAGSVLDLSGLDGGCVISLANCSYSLIEPNNVPKTVISITIDNTVHNAPSSLLLSSTSGVASWLNGLSLGTFAVSLDSGSGTISITSATNSHVISVINFTTGTGPLIRQFNRACVGLVTFLNAIITYLCNLSASSIAFGVAGKSYSIYNANGTITTTAIPEDTTLDVLLTDMLASEASLFNAISALGLTCTNIRSLFKTQTFAILPTDGVLGTQSGNCSLISFDQLAGIVLNSIGSNATWINNFCALVSNCSAPVCPPVTNVSATFASGTLTVNCNDAGSSSAVKVQYRIYNSGGTFTEVDTVSGSLPLAITSLANAVYEVRVSKVCSSNSIQSPWATAISNNTCTAPVSFSVTVSGSNFVIAGTLTSPQTIIQVQMTDPNGGITTATNDFGATSGTFNIPIPSSIFGNYTFIARAVCNNTSVPIFASNYTAATIVNVANPTAPNIFAYAAYGMSYSDISDGTASGIPSAFNGVVISHSLSANTPSLTAGTISVSLTGTIPGTPVIYLRLVKNGSTILDQQTITAAGTYTLTNPALIDLSSNTVNIEIDQA